MNSHWEGVATVQKGGRIEVMLPDFEPGEHVRVTVEREPQRRPFTFGLAKGKIIMREDFDAPLDEFQDYS